MYPKYLFRVANWSILGIGDSLKMPHEPKKRHSKAAKRTRRASISLKQASLLVCKNCNEKTLAHMICRNCGYYSGKLILEPKQKVTVTKA